jgi:hypothetical protein
LAKIQVRSWSSRDIQLAHESKKICNGATVGIRRISIHGRATRFHAEVAGHTINPLDEHTSYFRDGSELLYSIADIVSGHGDKLEEHGMTAGHRVQSPIPSWLPDFAPGTGIDPELVHRSTNDLRHTGG